MCQAFSCIIIKKILEENRVKEIYELIEAGKKKQGITSDRGYALANGILPQVIVDIKAGKSMPNAENMLKILAAAGKDVSDGIKAIQKQKEAGFAEVGLLLAMSTGAITLMSLAQVTQFPANQVMTGLLGSWSLYIM